MSRICSYCSMPRKGSILAASACPSSGSEKQKGSASYINSICTQPHRKYQSHVHNSLLRTHLAPKLPLRVRDEIKMYFQKGQVLGIGVKMEAYRYQSSCSKNRYCRAIHNTQSPKQFKTFSKVSQLVNGYVVLLGSLLGPCLREKTPNFPW